MTLTARATGALAVSAALVLALAGCGTPPWEHPGATDSASPAPSSSPSSIEVVHNDLATGSTMHTLHAGDVTLDVKYYSTLEIGQWQPTVDKPLSVSATASIGSDHGQNVYLSNVTMSVTVRGPHGALPAPAPQSDQATVQPGYVIKKPYSYAPTFIIPPLDKTATSVTVSIVYDMLEQTTPKSSTYAKVSTADTLTIALS